MDAFCKKKIIAIMQTASSKFAKDIFFLFGKQFEFFGLFFDFVLLLEKISFLGFTVELNLVFSVDARAGI